MAGVMIACIKMAGNNSLGSGLLLGVFSDALNRPVLAHLSEDQDSAARSLAL